MDRTFGNIYIKKRTVAEWLATFVFFLPFAQAFLSEFLRLPDEIKFLADAALIVLLFKIFLISRSITITKQLFPFLVIIGAFLHMSRFRIFLIMNPYYIIFGAEEIIFDSMLLL